MNFLTLSNFCSFPCTNECLTAHSDVINHKTLLVFPSVFEVLTRHRVAVNLKEPNHSGCPLKSLVSVVVKDNTIFLAVYTI